MGDYNKSASIVKLAVIGDVFKEGNVKPIPNDQIKSFNYTLLGDNAFKFVFELVNYDEALLSAITKSVNKIVKDAGTPDYTNLNPDHSDLTSLPKILVQFGYEDHKGNEILSKVHFSTVSEVDYKFSQGQEKILILTSVFDPTGGEEADPLDKANYVSTQILDIIFPVENTRTRADVFFKKSMSGEENTNPYITPFDIVINICRDLLRSKDAVAWTHLEPSGTPGERPYEVMSNKVLHDALSYKVDYRWNEHDDLKSWLKAGEAELKDGEGSWKDSFIVTSEMFGETGQDWIEGKTGFGSRQYSDLIQLLEPLHLSLERRYEEYGYWDNLCKTTVAALASVGAGVIKAVGSFWNATTSIFTNTFSSASDAISAWWSDDMELTYTVNENSGTNILEAVYGAVPDLNFHSSGNDPFTAEFRVNQTQTDRIVSGAMETPVTIRMITPHNSGLVSVNLHGREVVGYTVEGNQSQTGVLKDLLLEFQADMLAAIADNEDLNEVKNAEAEEAAATTPEDDGIPISGMSDSEKLNAFNRSIKFVATSDEGTSIFQTVDSIIKGYNKIFTHGHSQHEMGIAYISETSAGDFNTVLLEHEGQPLQTRLLNIVIGLRTDVVQYQEDFYGFDGPYSREILSSSITKEEEDHLVIHLDYGTNTSIIKFFDYTGDIRWLRNISSSIATNYHIDNIYHHLEGKAIKKSYTEVLPLLLQDPEFVKAMGKTGATTDITETLKKLENQLLSEYRDIDTGELKKGEGEGQDFYSTVHPVTAQELQDLKFVAEYIRSNEADNALTSDSDTFKDSLSSFHLFIAGIYESETVGLLMDQRKPDQGFYLKPATQFDKIAKSTSSSETRRKLSMYMDNVNMFAEVKIKTLGIPELSIIPDITSRPVQFSVYDPSEVEERKHWLSGTYRISALAHSISPSEGFSSEFTLLKHQIF